MHSAQPKEEALLAALHRYTASKAKAHTAINIQLESIMRRRIVGRVVKLVVQIVLSLSQQLQLMLNAS